jgi:uncharacterized protein YeaC (DUF1315 family)
MNEMSNQPEALRLAHLLELDKWPDAATELRRQHARTVELEEMLRREVQHSAGLKAARIAYASEFKPDANGDPDVGNIHANIRKLKAEVGKLQRKLAAEAEKNAEEKRRTAKLAKLHSIKSLKRIEEHLKREAARQDLKEYL